MSHAPTSTPAEQLVARIATCRLCAQQFAQTATAHEPRPVPWFASSATILIAGQAPGARVHGSGRPFSDPSGARLRDWLGLDSAAFYDRRHIAIVPAAFCFPGYSAAGSDLPPPPICARTWSGAVMQTLPDIRLRVLVGAYAHRLHLGTTTAVTETVRNWRRHAPATFVLPHPSWRNSGWLRKNPWFDAEVIPELRRAVRAALREASDSSRAS
jgi:uracil-DNA glycosylase